MEKRNKVPERKPETPEKIIDENRAYADASATPSYGHRSMVVKVGKKKLLCDNRFIYN